MVPGVKWYGWLAFGFATAFACHAGPLAAQDSVIAEAPVPAPAPEPVEHVYVALTTSAGVITLDLDKTHAPLTTANFLKYVDSKRMDGAVFYRAMHLDYSDEPAGLLQGGVRDGAKLLPPVAHETTNQTGILHRAGTVSMARFAPGSATADFMILMSDMPALDAEKGNTGQDPGAGFAAFGHVASGMDVVRAIWNMPRSATKGEGVMKGDILENEVRIINARRVAAPESTAQGQ
ncbi:peptidylprolyl isomerase [Novosphingobium album (ex Hu et al. 2023)]|uniref:peptidylprolyl isomerase n=1 Tax=Novosphingobium album (ex Hu et al. 2023) TaxID=2930093 RepID=A0ABT0AZ79_9SPHN|nr:peptidylprolyl isomerase [Novosphingobium album (ex Hu et al. 2023)]MCJ2178090.1 peptidylprolyl isomerase [Novosphingobium album (ex Hu et al. 2023)]